MAVAGAGEPVRRSAEPGEVALFSVATRDGQLGDVNTSFADLLGLDPGEVAGRSVLELVHPDDLARIVTGLAALDGGQHEALLECRFKQSDGAGVRLQWVARQVPGTDTWTAAGRNCEEFDRLVAERLDLQTRLGLALGHATAAMWELDLAGGRFTWEPQAAEVLGVDRGSAPADAGELAAAVHPDDAEGVLAAFTQLLDSGSTEAAMRVGQGAQLRYLSLRGKVQSRDDEAPRRAVGIVLDITTEKAMEEQMRLMLMSDALTGVPNRRAFDRALRGEWRRCTRAMTPFSIVMIDIDDFKGFNDAFGHLVGDAALCSVARALAACLGREGDLLARFGGEEFVVVLPDTDADGALTVGERLVEAVRKVTLRQAADWDINVSVGTATWQPDGPAANAGEVLARADDALYAAKAAGKNRAVAYEYALAARAALEADIARALAENEFELHYQPLIGLQAGEVLGFEALIRWNRPGHGLVAPDVFIPAAEASTLICDIGRWALREAACQLATWSREGLDDSDHAELCVAVNASGRHVCSPTIVDDVQAALAASGIAPERLDLELTETTLTDSPLAAVHLACLRGLGVTVAIDDFGTGYTSVGQLPRLPADTVKIDRSFIGSTDASQHALVALIIGAAHACGLRVIAEGIENAETLHMLRALDCDAAQGFLMARPMPAPLVTAWLADWRTTNRDALIRRELVPSER